MIFLLFILLILMLFFAYYATGKDILSPWMISICMFIFSVFVALLNFNYWNEDISALTVFVILSGLTFFGFGEFVGKAIIKSGKKINNSSDIKNVALINDGREIEISNKWIIISSCFVFVIAYFYYRFIQRIAMLAGFQDGIKLLLFYARNAQFDVGIDSDLSMLMNLGITLSRIISYFFIFIFIYNTVFFKFRVKFLKYLIPVILNIANALLSTGRTQFINLITVILILFFIMLKQKTNWSSKINTKILFYGILGIILFLVCFRFAGYLTAKSGKYTLWDNLSKYIGASIISLDKYLQNPPDKAFFGKETLSSIYHILRKIGFDIPQYSIPNEFIGWENMYNNNIYTSFRRYIQDFTIMGMCIIELILGSFYGGFYGYIKYKNKVSIAIIIYAMYFFPIVQCALEERFFMNVVSIGGLYNLIAIIVVWKFFIKKDRKTKRI